MCFSDFLVRPSPKQKIMRALTISGQVAAWLGPQIAALMAFSYWPWMDLFFGPWATLKRIASNGDRTHNAKSLQKGSSDSQLSHQYFMFNLNNTTSSH